MNRFDGDPGPLDDRRAGRALPGAKLAKAFNTIGFENLATARERQVPAAMFASPATTRTRSASRCCWSRRSGSGPRMRAASPTPSRWGRWSRCGLRSPPGARPHGGLRDLGGLRTAEPGCGFGGPEPGVSAEARACAGQAPSRTRWIAWASSPCASRCTEGGRRGVRCLDEAEQRACLLVDPVPLVVDAVADPGPGGRPRGRRRRPGPGRRGRRGCR